MTTAPSRVQLQLLGAPSADRSKGKAAGTPLTQPRRLALLAYLTIARPRGLHARETLLALLWPDQDEAHGRKALRNALHGIRKSLGDALLVTAGDGLVGVDPTQIDCDVLGLEAELAEGRLERAAALHETELLQGFHVLRAPGFARWLDDERQRLRARVVAAVSVLADDGAMRGDPDAALRAARVAARLDPDGERTLRRLVEALVAVGDRVQALRAYQAFVDRLKAEYGATPSSATSALVLRIRDAAAPVRDGSAYVAYVRGTYLFLRAAHGGHVDDMHRSRTFFEQALDLDPGFAPAFAGLSNYFAAAAARNLLRPFEPTFGRAIELSREALALDPKLAIPHVHFGVQAMYLKDDWETAGREFAEAVALDPAYPEARRFRGIHLGATGDWPGAIREMREAVRLEPQIAIFRNSLADALMVVGDIDGAIVELRAAIEADARYAAARERLIRCLVRLGRYEEAIAERRFMGPAGRADAFQAAFDADGEEGYRRERALELGGVMRRLEAAAAEDPPRNAGDLFNPPELRLALACAELGDLAAARRWEEQACRTRPGRRRWFAARPELASG